MTNDTRLSARKKLAAMYLFLTALAPSRSGLRLRKVERRAWKGGRAEPFSTDWSGRPRSSLLPRRGCWERPSVGRWKGGRASPAIFSSSVSESEERSAAKALGSWSLTLFCTGVEERLRGGGDVRVLLVERMERRCGDCGREEGWELGLVDGVAMVGDMEERLWWSGLLGEGRRLSLFVIHANESGRSTVARRRKEGARGEVVWLLSGMTA